jgi:hypothetical protein
VCLGRRALGKRWTERLQQLRVSLPSVPLILLLAPPARSAWDVAMLHGAFDAMSASAGPDTQFETIARAMRYVARPVAWRRVQPTTEGITPLGCGNGPGKGELGGDEQRLIAAEGRRLPRLTPVAHARTLRRNPRTQGAGVDMQGLTGQKSRDAGALDPDPLA